jgi:hypothetical protein
MVVVLSFNFFMMSYQVNGLNRLVMNAPISLFETAIELMDISEENGPIFNKETLERNLTSYFDFSLPHYTEDYEVGFYYYNPSDHSVCIDENAKAVEVTVNASFIFMYQYQKTMFYEIRSN